jgi:hypothetical protein
VSKPTDRPDPRCCLHCQATEADCENKQVFRATKCCESCDHDPTPGGVIDRETARVSTLKPPDIFLSPSVRTGT